MKEVEDEANEERHGMRGTRAVDTEATVINHTIIDHH